MSQPVKAHQFTYNTEGQEMTLASSEELQSMMAALEENLNNVSDELKTRFRKLVISQLSLTRYKHKDYNIKYVHAKANGADIQQYTIDNIPQGMGQKHAEKTIDEIIETHKNHKLDQEELIEEEKETFVLSPRNERELEPESTHLEREQFDNVNETQKVRPPVAPRTRRPSKAYGGYFTSKPQPTPHSVQVSYDHSYTDEPHVSNCKVQFGNNRPSVPYNSLQDTRLDNGNSYDSSSVNIEVKIKKRNTNPSVEFGARLIEKEIPSVVSKPESSDNLADLREQMEAERLLLRNETTPQSGESFQAPLSTEHTEGWKNLRNRLKSGKLLLEKEMPTERNTYQDIDNETSGTGHSDRWKKIKHHMEEGNLMLDNEMPIPVSNTRSAEGWAKLRDHVRSGKLLLEKEISKEGTSDHSSVQVGNPKEISSSCSPEGWAKLRDTFKSGKLIIEKEMSRKDTSQVQPNMPSKRSEGWKKLQNHFKAGELLVEKELSNKANQLSNEPTTVKYSEKWKKLQNHMKAGELLLEKEMSARDDTLVTSEMATKRSEGWKKLQDHLKAGELLLEDEISAQNDRPLNEHTATKRSEGWKKLQDHFKAGELLLEKELSAKDDKLTKSPMASERTEGWKKLQNHLKAGELLLEKEFSANADQSGNDSMATKRSEGWRKLQDHLKAGEILLEKELSTEDDQSSDEPTSTKRSEGWRKLQDHLKAGELLLEKELSIKEDKSVDVDDIKPERSEGWAKLKSHLKAGELMLEKEVSGNENQSMATKRSEGWRKLQNHLKAGELLLEKELSAKDDQSLNKPSTSNRSEGWKKLQNHLKAGELLLEKEISNKEDKTVNEVINSERSEGWKQLKNHLKAGELLLEKELSTNDDKTAKTPMTSGRSEGWKKLKRQLKPGGLLVEKEMSSKDDQSINKNTTSKRSEGWQKLKNHLKAGDLLLEKELSNKDNESAETTTASKYSEGWRKLKNHLKAGELLLDKEISTDEKEPATSKHSEGWRKLRNHLKAGELLMEKEMSAEESQMDTKRSEGWRKLRNHLNAGELLVEKEVTPAINNSEPTKGIAKLREHFKSGKIVLENQRKTNTVSPTGNERRKSVSLGSSAKPETLGLNSITMENDDDEPETSDFQNETAKTTNTSDRWKKLRERLKYRKASLENDITSALPSSPIETQIIRNTDSDVRSDYDIQLLLARSRSTNSRSHATLSRIRGFVIMLTNLAQMSGNDEASTELRNGAHAELAAIEDDVDENLTGSDSSNAILDMDKAENLIKDKLNELGSSERPNITALGGDIHHLAIAATRHGTADCDETVLLEIRELLPHLYNLSCLLPSEDSHKSRISQNDKACQCSLVGTATWFNTIITVIVRPYTYFRAFIPARRGVTLPESCELEEHDADDSGDDETSLDNEEPTDSISNLPPTVDAIGSTDSSSSTQDDSQQSESNDSQHSHGRIGNFNSHNHVALDKKKGVSKQKLRSSNQNGGQRVKTSRPDVSSFGRLCRFITGVVFIGLCLFLLFATNFKGSIMAAWLYCWAFMSCNVRLIHSSAEPVV